MNYTTAEITNMGIPHGLHIACTYAYASTFDVKNFSTDTYMASICDPYGNHICVHTIWASYDNAIGGCKHVELEQFLALFLEVDRISASVSVPNVDK